MAIVELAAPRGDARAWLYGRLLRYYTLIQISYIGSKLSVTYVMNIDRTIAIITTVSFQKVMFAFAA